MPRRRFPRIAGLGLPVLVTLLVMIVFGTFVPTIPYIAFGQLIMAWVGPWIVILSIFAALLSFRRWRRTRGKRTLVMGCAAAAAALGSGVIVTEQFCAIRASGVEVDLARSLYLGPMSHRSAAPEFQVYSRYADQDVPLAIFRPAAKPSARPAPVLIYVHGGGWISGGYRFRDHDLRWFADRGLVVVSVEYTLSDANRHLWDFTHSQIGCAMAWVGANIARFGGDPARIAMIGESAGGNLVINVAYMANQGTLRPACPGALPHVAAIVSLYPVIDVADFYRADGDGYTATSRDMAAAYTGGTPEQFPERYAAVSSASHISAAAPATILVVGERDTLVSPEPAYAFARQAREKAVDIQLIRVPFAGHSFDFLGGSINNQLIRNALMRILAKQGMAP